MVSRNIKGLLKEPFKMLKGILMRSRFVRLTPNQSGRIHFLDRKRKKMIGISSRGFIDSFTADQIYTYDEYSFDPLIRNADIQAMYQAMLDRSETPLIIDCGGNIGLASRYFAEEFPEARIICIEPNEGNIALARKNCQGFGNIVFKEAAVGATDGHAAILDENADANAFRVGNASRPNLSEAGAPSEVAMISIDRVLAENEGCAFFIAKIDIEGFEEDLFSRNTGWIDACPMMIVELHDWMLPRSANSANFLKAIATRDRDFVFRGENVFSIRNP